MKIALIGYGKMGKAIEKIAHDRGHEVVLKVNSTNLRDLTQENIKKADVAIEFSLPESAVTNISLAFDSGVAVVVGTTAWLDKLQEIEKECKAKDGSLFYASNFSLGVNIMFHLNEKLASIMNDYPDYDVEVEEIHHVHKLDSPSGTGLSIANQILDRIDRKTSWTEGDEKGTNALMIKAKREGETPGTHIVKYNSEIDDIELKHVAHGRTGFAMGAVLAAEFLKGKKGIYQMKDLLKL